MNTQKSKQFNMVRFHIPKSVSNQKHRDRGKYEMDLMAKYTADSMTDLTHPFSMRALNVGTSTAGGHTVASLAGKAPAFGGLV